MITLTENFLHWIQLIVPQGLSKREQPQNIYFAFVKLVAFVKFCEAYLKI